MLDRIVAVAEALVDLDLAEEPLRSHQHGDLGPQNLDRDLPLMLEVGRQEDTSHPAGADLVLDAVAIGQCRLQALHPVGHGWPSGLRLLGPSHATG